MNNLRDKWGEGPIYLDRHLDTLTPDEQSFMREFDTDGDGALDLKREVRDAIVMHSEEVLDDRAQRFKRLVGRVIADRSGWTVDVTERGQAKQEIHWLTIQLNNPRDRRLVEAKDLLRAARRHPDKPHVDIVNFTTEFNAQTEAEFTEFVDTFIVDYCESLEARKAKLGLFDLSGHSNGTDMLQEVPNPNDAHGHWYVPKWNPRFSLRQLKADHPAVAHQLDICETVALQACFHGGNATAWAEIFSNEDVVISGTVGYSPLSASHASHAIAQGGLTAREALERGASPEGAQSKGLHVPSSNRLRRDRGFVVYIRNEATSLAHARFQVTSVESGFDTAKSRILGIRSAGERAVSEFGQTVLDEIYALTLAYQNALNSLWIIEGRPGGADGARSRAIALVSFLREDLFAIRKHALTERPSEPVWLPAAYRVGSGPPVA